MDSINIHGDGNMLKIAEHINEDSSDDARTPELGL